MALPVRKLPVSTVALSGARARSIPPPPPIPRGVSRPPPPPSSPAARANDALIHEVRQLRADLDLVLDATGKRLDAVDRRGESVERHVRRQHERIRELERARDANHERMKVLAKKLLSLVTEVRGGKSERLDELERAIAHLEEDLMLLERRALHTPS